MSVSMKLFDRWSGGIQRSFAAVLLSIAVVLSILSSGHAQSAAKGQGSDTPTPPIAFAARVIGDETRARLIIDFDRDVQHDAYLLDKPNRIIVDLPETFFSLGDDFRKLPKSLITDLRFGTIAPGQSRVVMQVDGAVKIENDLVKKVAGEDHHRLIIDVVRSDQGKFLASVRKAAAAHDPHNETGKNSPARKFTIVLDPGHGGIDGGATGVGKTIEKQITLDFALKLREQLQKHPRFNVVMTRESDSFIGLVDRVETARKNQADLMISIHADSLGQREIRGATIYTLSEEGSDDISRSLARKQNRADLIAGLELPSAKPAVSDILIDMIRRETEIFSRRFARLLVGRIRPDFRLIRNPNRSADFYVLKAPEVPSILLELGYLSNSEDEQLMKSPQWQLLLATKTADAISAFFDVSLAKQ